MELSLKSTGRASLHSVKRWQLSGTDYEPQPALTHWSPATGGADTRFSAWTPIGNKSSNLQVRGSRLVMVHSRPTRNFIEFPPVMSHLRVRRSENPNKVKFPRTPVITALTCNFANGSQTRKQTTVCIKQFRCVYSTYLYFTKRKILPGSRL